MIRVPETIPAIQTTELPRNIFVSSKVLPGLTASRQPITITMSGLSDPLFENSILEIEEGKYIVIGELLGEGGQSRVYSIVTCKDACIKIGRNSISAKQFRREVIGYPHYITRGIACPEILSYDIFGRYIIKKRLPSNLINGTKLLSRTTRVLTKEHLQHLISYIRAFEKDGITIDAMPSNVLFFNDGCGSYETPIWKAKPYGTWSFAGCFLLEWLPDRIVHRSANGWPPFFLSRKTMSVLRYNWNNAREYSNWRNVFGEFPELCPEWWIQKEEPPDRSEYVGPFPPI